METKITTVDGDIVISTSRSVNPLINIIETKTDHILTPESDLKNIPDSHEIYGFIKDDLVNRGGGWWENEVPLEIPDIDVKDIKFLSLMENDPQNPLKVTAITYSGKTFKWAFGDWNGDWNDGINFVNVAMDYIETLVTTTCIFSNIMGGTNRIKDGNNLKYLILDTTNGRPLIKESLIDKAYILYQMKWKDKNTPVFNILNVRKNYKISQIKTLEYYKKYLKYWSNEYKNQTDLWENSYSIDE